MLIEKSLQCVFLPLPLKGNGVDLRETRCGSRVGFRRMVKLDETLGEFRYVKYTPFPLKGARGALVYT